MLPASPRVLCAEATREMYINCLIVTNKMVFLHANKRNKKKRTELSIKRIWENKKRFAHIRIHVLEPKLKR